MDAAASQGTLSSLDSSLFQDSEFDDDTDSTQSLKSALLKSKQQSHVEQFLSIERPRIEERRESQFLSANLPGFDQPFIGFVGGRGRAIEINESKIKRAKRLISSQLSQQTEPKQSLMDSKGKESDYLEKAEEGDQEKRETFEVGFKNMRSGFGVKISEQSNAFIKDFLSDLQSMRKETKIKRNSALERPEMSLFQTVGAEEKKKKMGVSKNAMLAAKKPATPRQKRIIRGLLAKKEQEPKLQRISYCQLPVPKNYPYSKLEEEWRRNKRSSLSHKENQCGAVYCYFCEKYRNEEIEVTPGMLQSEIASLFSLEPQVDKQVPQLIYCIQFKLTKYSTLYPQLINKQYHPNTLLLELHKKCLILATGVVPPLSSAILSRRVFGKHLYVGVMSVCYSEEIESFFIEISDGWTCALGVVSQSNLLSQVLRAGRIGVGDKMEIVDWKIHPICNLYEYHPDEGVRKMELPCIEFGYNNSLPLPSNCKLGPPKSVFYREVKKYKVGGGLLPMVSGIVVRMYSMGSSKSHWVQILVEENYTVLIKMALPPEVSLVEMFRLYYPYHFRRVKKNSHDMLQFNSLTVFYEIEDKQRMAKLSKLLQGRLLNLKSVCCGLTGFWDAIVQSNCFVIEGICFEVDEEIREVVLLQQYEAIERGEKVMLRRGDRGNCLRRIPKIYQSFSYQVL